MAESHAPFLSAWFEIMDSDTPSRILDLISEDFTFSILFSTGADPAGDAAGDPAGNTTPATDFTGGRAAMEHYLDQREKGTLTHHQLATAASADEEFFLGEVRRGGVPAASFVAVGRVGPAGTLRHLLIGRSPGVRFESPAVGGADVQPGAVGRPTA